MQAFTPEQIADNLRAAEERKNKALAEYKSALVELDWWREGQRIFDPASVEERTVNAEEILELFPAASAFQNGNEPSLRQAIVALLRESPGARWTVSDIVSRLAGRGWLPRRTSTKEAAKRVSDMAGVMVADNQLERAGRGVYILAPELAAAFEAQEDEGVPAEADTPH